MNIGKTIVAQASGSGGAIAIIRTSGPDAFEICDQIFRSPKGRHIAQQKSHTILYGSIVDTDNQVIDDVLVSVFRAPHSYTGEDSVEISCHASSCICRSIIGRLIDKGAVQADAGEFTARAFLNGRMDLSQAEAVADIIASSSRSALIMARTQMSGSYSLRLQQLRQNLLHIASLLELELDFGEEDVTFADRHQLHRLVGELSTEIGRAIDSFRLGNAIKNGIGVVIIGPPNVGKSTLLNRILGEERVLVSDVAGTTRDAVEQSLTIDGVLFRFIDTAGLRQSDDKLEQMGMQQTIRHLQTADVVLQMVDATRQEFAPYTPAPNQHLIVVVNKIDAIAPEGLDSARFDPSMLDMQALALPSDIADNKVAFICAKTGFGVEGLLEQLRQSIDTDDLYDGASIVSNGRHYQEFVAASEALQRVDDAMANNLTTDLIAQTLREAIRHIGAITGEITDSEILNQIFSKFCIGK